jgi:hypothetical protein
MANVTAQHVDLLIFSAVVKNTLRLEHISSGIAIHVALGVELESWKMWSVQE